MAFDDAVIAEETVVTSAGADGLSAIHAALDRFWRAVDAAVAQPPGEEWRLRFAIAVAEVAANIVRHAYPSEAAARPMRLRLRSYSDRAVACFTDEGVVYVPRQIAPISTLDPLTLPEGGFGLALARTALDQLDYERTPGGENHWRLVKRFTSGP